MVKRCKGLQIMSFYVKVAAACFALGGAMEMFMLRTGFYDK